MAFLPQDPTQQQQQAQQGQIPTVPQIPTLQGTSGPTASQSSGTTNTASPGAAPTTPWQNITSYLNANADQAGNVANTIAGNLGSQYNTANQAIGQAQQNFGQQIEGARVPFNQDLASRAAASPSQLVKNPNDVSAFQKMFKGQYQGPQNFSGTPDYSNLQAKVQNAQKQAALVNQGSEGLMTLLQQAESQGGRNPTQGVTALDSLLMQEDPNNFGKLSAAAQPFAGLTDYLGRTQQGLDASAQNAAQEAAATQAQLQGQFLGPGGVAPSMQQKLNDELQQASQQARGYNTSIADVIGKLNSGQPLTLEESHLVDPAGTLQTINPFGQSGGVFQDMLSNGFPGIGPGMLAQYYNAPSQIAQPGMENVMTPQEYADAQAINQLTGQTAVGVPAQLGKSFAVPQSMGSFQDQAALQSLYDTLSADQGAVFPSSGAGSTLNSLIPQSQQQINYLNDMQLLAAYLGLPSPVQATVQPVEEQTPSGPPYLQPLAQTTGTTLTSGGGFAFR